MNLRRTLLPTCLCMSLHAWAAEYWVDQQHERASDTNVGTSDAPWLTVGKAAKTLSPGDTVVVRPGVYRERVAPKSSGAKGQPITYRAEGCNVVISGADQILGWQKCTPETCPGSSHHESIWWAEVAWEPNALFQRGRQLAKAREPNTGWWVAEGGGTHTIVDSKHLTQPGGYWSGATVFFWDVSVTTQGWRKITKHDANIVTLDRPIYRDRVVEPGRDRYYIENALPILDRPGEWVVDTTVKPHRLYLWPQEGADPNVALIEAPRRGRFIFEYGNREHLRIDGFEVRHGASHGIGTWARTAKDIVISDCYVHHNQGHALYLTVTEGLEVKGNLVAENHYGLSCARSKDVVIEANEIRDNAFDGLVVSHNTSNVVIRSNYIHGHTRWGHPDNIQFHNGLTNVSVERNVILDGGQSIMMEECENGVIRGNVVVGSAAVALIFGHRNTNQFKVLNNTVAFTGYGAMSFTGKDYEVRHNIIYPGSGNPIFVAGDAVGLQSDYNLLFKPVGLRGTFAAPGRRWPKTFEEYRRVSGLDAHSVSADPQFINAPICSAQVEERRLFDCTTSKLFLRGSIALFEVGDHVEVTFDRVVRQVTAVAKDHIVIEPPLRVPLEKGVLVLNWKDRTDFALDLRVGPNSPARGAGNQGVDIGADLDIQAFARGDVDGDGQVDVRRP